MLASNFDLAGAVARVEQARARERIAKSPAFPLLQPSVGVNDFDTPTNAGIGAQLDELGLGSATDSAIGIALPDRLGLTTYNISAEFAYELDFWGRNRNDARAAGAERLASEADYLTARMGVLAETVRTYLEIANLRHQHRLAGEIVEVFQQRQSLADSLYDRGLIDRRGLFTARRNLRNAQAELPQIEALLADAEGRLWVLMGGYRAELADLLPDSLTPSAALDPVPAGIPADLLVQRPDVSAARQRVAAARYTLGARRADLLPKLSLSGSIGLQSTEAGELFDPEQWFRNLSANLLGPVFQGSRLRSSVALAEARLNEAAAAFGRSVVTAVNEVEAALVGLEASRRRHSLLASLAVEAQAEAALQEQRYVSGVGDYESFLTATHTFLGTQSVLATAARDLGYARLVLHRQLNAARAAFDRDEARLADANLALSRTKVTAPFAGFVQEESVDVGQIVAAGQPVARIFATDAMEVIVPLSDADAALIPGLWSLAAGDGNQTVAVRIVARYGDGIYAWDGYVDRGEASLDKQTRTIDVIVRVPDPINSGTPIAGTVPLGGSPPLLVGKFVEVEIEGLELEGYYQVPRAALQSGNEVWVVNDGGAVSIVPVQILQRTNDEVYVTGTLASGQAVITGGIQFATEGMRVLTGVDPTP